MASQVGRTFSNSDFFASCCGCFYYRGHGFWLRSGISANNAANGSTNNTPNY
jgi:hypothetical protein